VFFIVVFEAGGGVAADVAAVVVDVVIGMGFDLITTVIDGCNTVYINMVHMIS